jgi:hypothetical protein
LPTRNGSEATERQRGRAGELTQSRDSAYYGA